MIVIRNVFQLKYGKAREALAVMKEGLAIQKRLATDVSARLLTDVTGPHYTLVLELTVPNLATFEAEAEERVGDGFVVGEGDDDEINAFDFREVVGFVVVIDEAVAVGEELGVADVLDADLVSLDLGGGEDLLLIDPVAVVGGLAVFGVEEGNVELGGLPVG